MRYLISILLVLYSCSTPAPAQTTNFTATITDADGQIWSLGTWRADFVGANPAYSGGQPIQRTFSGAMDGSGTFSATLPDNLSVSPAGSQWKFTICPNASSACGIQTLTVTGATQNGSSSLSSGVTAPRFAAGPSSYGYRDQEVTPLPLPGGQYFNVTTNNGRTWNGTAWVNNAGGGASTPATNAILKGTGVANGVTSATASDVNTLLQGGANCLTPGFVYQPSSGTCVTATGASTPATLQLLKGNGSANSVTAATSADVLNVQLGTGNILQYSFGVNVLDGNAHPISGATGTPFAGITTLAGLAALTTATGYHPFFFLTDSGSITGPMCTFGSTTNCFTSGSGYYRLTDASVPSLDIRWLALQAAALTRRMYVPTGTIATTFSVMLPITQEGSGVSMSVQGDGPALSQISAASDFGAGVCAVTSGDPAATSGNNLGRWNSTYGGMAGTLQNIAVYNTGTKPTIAAPGWQMCGLALGTHWATLLNVQVFGWNKGVTFTGDHAQFDSLYLPMNYIGFYWDAPMPNLLGNVNFKDFRSESFWEGMGVNAAATMSFGSTGNFFDAAPFPFFCETGSTACMNGVTMQQLQTESTVLAVVQDQSNMPGVGTNGASYVDSAKNRSLVNVDFGKWFNLFITSSDSAVTSINPNFRRRAALDVAAVSGLQLQWQSESAGTGTPNAPGGTINAPVGLLNLNAIANTYQVGVDLRGDMDNLIASLGTLATGNTETVPVVNHSLANAAGRFITLHKTGYWDGAIFPLGSGNASYGTTTAGDLFEGNNGQGYPAGLSNGVQPILGVAMQSNFALPSSGYKYVILANRGTLPVNAGYNGFNSLSFKSSTGTGLITINSAGTGGTNGTYNITATGGGCTVEAVVQVTVTGGSITGVTKTTQDYGCTSTPSLSTSSITGLTGGALGLVWPSAQMQPASNAGPGTLLGAYGGFAGGNPATGTLFEAVLFGSFPSTPTSGSAGVSSINTITGPFSFTGSGVNCVSTTCTFNGGGVQGPVTLTTGTAALAANTCSSVVTTTATGMTTASHLLPDNTGSSAALNGWGAVGGLRLFLWPTANAISSQVCNQSNATITPDPITFSVGWL